MASATSAGCCRGTYAEGAIILCATISAMSSRAWNGREKGIDRKRFVEIITKFRPPQLDPTMVSMPLLVQENQGCDLQSTVSAKAFYLPEAVDRDEREVIRRCPQLPVRRVRK